MGEEVNPNRGGAGRILQVGSSYSTDKLASWCYRRSQVPINAGYRSRACEHNDVLERVVSLAVETVGLGILEFEAWALSRADPMLPTTRPHSLSRSSHTIFTDLFLYVSLIAHDTGPLHMLSAPSNFFVHGWDLVWHYDRSWAATSVEEDTY